MPAELVLVKAADGALHPATEADLALMSGWQPGHAVKVKAVQMRPRSLQHHKLYFGGLLKLAMDYWEPKGGLLTPAEIDTMRRYNQYLGRRFAPEGAQENTLLEALKDVGRSFLRELRAARAERFEAPSKEMEALHRWVKVEAGWYRLVQTPRGIAKEPLSINFNSMDQDEFNRFYKAAFSVVWRLVLSQVFESEAQCQQAIDQLASMG